MLLKQKNNNWVDKLGKNIEIYNHTPHRGILDFTPNEVMKDLEVRGMIASHNASKNLKNNSESDVKIGDKVRVYIKGKFDKGNDQIYSDEVYTVKQVSGKKLTLDNDVVKKRSSLLIVPKDTKSSNEKNFIKKAKKQYKNELILKKEDVKEENIVTTRYHGMIVDPKGRESLIHNLKTM